MNSHFLFIYLFFHCYDKSGRAREIKNLKPFNAAVVLR